jgi:glucose-1-phosphate thymidylyltransferase
MTIRGMVYVPWFGAPNWREPPAHQIANRALVCHILESLASGGLESLAVVAGAEQLREARAHVAEDEVAAALTVSFHEIPEPVGPREALRAISRDVGEDPVLLHLATGLLGQPPAALVAGLAEPAVDMLLLLHRTSGRMTPLSPETERLLGVSEIGAPDARLALCGLAAFGPGALARAAGLPEMRDTDPDADPTQAIAAVADALAERQFTVAAGIAGDWCESSNDPAAMLELNRSVLDRQAATPLHSGHTAGSRIEGRVVIHPTAKVNASVILGPTLIGARACIQDAYIGPYTTIGADAVIENCEIVRSIVGERAHIRHLSERIEGSTIGRGANVFRDFSLPRAIRLHVGDNTELSLE